MVEFINETFFVYNSHQIEAQIKGSENNIQPVTTNGSINEEKGKKKEKFEIN